MDDETYTPFTLPSNDAHETRIQLDYTPYPYIHHLHITILVVCTTLMMISHSQDPRAWELD